MLELIQRQYGGTICNKSDKSKAWALKWVGKENIRNILNVLAPHVILKKEQVLLGLKFIETIRDENLGCRPLPEDIHSERKEIYDNLRTLKIVNVS